MRVSSRFELSANVESGVPITPMTCSLVMPRDNLLRSEAVPYIIAWHPTISAAHVVRSARASTRRLISGPSVYMTVYTARDNAATYPVRGFGSGNGLTLRLGGRSRPRAPGAVIARERR